MTKFQRAFGYAENQAYPRARLKSQKENSMMSNTFRVTFRAITHLAIPSRISHELSDFRRPANGFTARLCSLATP
jgi:hypothetical protein